MRKFKQPGLRAGFTLILLSLAGASVAMTMNVNLVAGGTQTFTVEQVRKITYNLTAPASMNVIMKSDSTTAYTLSAVRSITFTGQWTGTRRQLERIRARLASVSLKRSGGMAALSFSLPQSEEVRVNVLTVDGRLVRTLLRGTATAGDHTVFWNGCDEGGTRVSNGTYLLRLDRKQDARVFKFITIR